jgi:murein DD-endopeptidase MepM/ murein hydrolase activator NlpD
MLSGAVMKQLMNWTSALVLAASLALASAGPGLTRPASEADKTATKSTQKAKPKAKASPKAKAAQRSKSKVKSKVKVKSNIKTPLGKVLEGPDTYRVSKGDTVYAIAERLKVTPETLIKMNGLKKPYGLVVGRTIKVPAAKVYVIKPGDSLYAISKRFGVDVDSLAAVNKTGATAPIKPGQKLALPAEARDLVAEAEAANEKQLAMDKAEAARLAKLKAAARIKGRYPAEATSSVARAAPAPMPAPAPAPEPRLDLGTLGINKPEPAREAPAQPTGMAATPAPAPRPIFPPPTGAMPNARVSASVTPGPATPSSSVPRPATPSAATPSAATSIVASTVGLAASVLDPAPAPPTEAEIIASGRGRFIWPVRGDIVSGFGPKDTGQRNDGINIAGKEGDLVRSAAAGDVVYSGNLVPGFGNLVLIKHDGGWVTAYAHLSKTLVKIRDRIAQGQDIGAVGKTGGVETPQLHFELRYAPSPKEKAKPVDPALVMPR